MYLWWQIPLHVGVVFTGEAVVIHGTEIPALVDVHPEMVNVWA